MVNGRHFAAENLVFARVDPVVDFDFGVEGPDHGALGRLHLLERNPLHPAGNCGVEQRQRGDFLIEHLDAVRGSDEERLRGRDAGGRVGHAHLPVAGEFDDDLLSRPGERRDSQGDDGNGKD